MKNIDRITKQRESLKLKIQGQITGLHNHLNNLENNHRKIETNSKRAIGHCEEAIRLSLKLRRLNQLGK